MTASNMNTDNLSHHLAGTGLRSTPQREIVYSVLTSKRDHPTADELFARVKQQMPNISLATVYNCLETLVQCNLVRQVTVERGAMRYCPTLHPHAHFFNETTGETIDVEIPAEVLAQVSSVLPKHFKAKSVEILFRGVVDNQNTPTSL